MCQMRGSITSRVHRAWLVSGMWWVTSPSEDPLMDLCKVQVNAPPSLEIPVKFFARYCAYTSVS
jgi:hypothetical protein